MGMRVFIPGFLLFAVYVLLGRWYFVCEVRHHCADGETITDGSGTLVLTEGDKIVLEGFEQFYFPPDSLKPVVSEGNRRFLREVASYLAQDPDRHLVITAFYLRSEHQGPSGFFENLGQARAAQIGLLLEDLGVDPLRITLHHMVIDRETLVEPARFLIRNSDASRLINESNN